MKKISKNCWILIKKKIIYRAFLNKKITTRILGRKTGISTFAENFLVKQFSVKFILSMYNAKSDTVKLGERKVRESR